MTFHLPILHWKKTNEYVMIQMARCAVGGSTDLTPFAMSAFTETPDIP